MRMQHAIFVDAGYLLTQALTIVSNKTSKHRKDLDIKDPPGLLMHLRSEARKFASNTRLLRTYWYDGVSASMTPEQIKIASLPDLHFRGGSLHNKKQKGVDGRIVQDLFELASEGVISDALIVTGDGDLSVGIEFAQRRGVRVAILGIEDLPNGVSPNRHAELAFLADALISMGSVEIQKYFAYTAPVVVPAPVVVTTAPPPPAPNAPVSTLPTAGGTTQAPKAAVSLDKATLDGIAKTVADSILPANLAATLNKAGGVMSDTDRQLLAEGRKELNRVLTTDERNYLRVAYRGEVAKRASTIP